MRTKLLAANWKMHKTPDQTREFFRDFLPLVAGHSRDDGTGHVVAFFFVSASFSCKPLKRQSAIRPSRPFGC